MLMTLIKKQYRECFRSYFVNPKTGKARGNWSRAGLFLLFGAVMVLVGGMAFGISFSLGSTLSPLGYTWLFYGLMGSTAMLLGVFGSVFNTFTMLYLAKDNDLLLAMPIPPSRILLSRMSLVYGMALLYTGVVWLPGLVYAWIFTAVTWKMVLFQLLLFPLITLVVTVLTCGLGWLVALISTRLKSKNLLIVVLSLAFVFGYYYVCMNMTSLFTVILENASAIGEGMRTWANLLYQLGLAADGNGRAMLIFGGTAVTLAAVCLLVMAGSFRSIVAGTHGAERQKSERIEIRPSGLGRTMLRRELLRFASSSAYMLNCGFGLVFLVVFAGVFAVRQELVWDILRSLVFLPGIQNYAPLLLIGIVNIMSATNFISTPSISLEGKSLWVLRSLPVSGRQVLRAKLGLHVLLNALPVTAAAWAVAWVMKMELTTGLLAWVYCLGTVWLCGAFGLTVGVLRPNFQWTSEIIPIKQSVNSMLSMLVGLLVPMAVCAGGCFLMKWLSTRQVMAASAALVLLAGGLMQLWLDTKGAERFEHL